MAQVNGRIAKRRSFKLTEKKAIIERAKELQSTGKSMRSIAAELKIPHTTLVSIIEKEEKIEQFLAKHPTSQITTFAHNHDPIVAQMEVKLLNWMEEQVGQGVQLTEAVIRTKAKWLYDCICDQIGHESKFLASPGWYCRFKKRKEIHCAKNVDESALVDCQQVGTFVEEFAAIVTKGGYSLEQIYNVDETGMFWRQKKGRTHATTGKQVSVKGETVDRVTLLLGGNASGTHKLKPMLIHKFEKPRALVNVDKSTLPVHYRWNDSCWMFADIFTDWFYNCFIPEVKAHLQSKRLPLKALLVLDNAPVHPTDLKYPGVQVVFMPPNTSCFLQPMQLNVIQTFKSYYKRNVMYEACAQNGHLSPSEYWSQFEIDSCIRHTANAWEQVSTQKLHDSWKQILPSMWKDDANTMNQSEVESVTVPDEFDLTGDPSAEIMNRAELTKNEISDLKRRVQSGDTDDRDAVDLFGSESMDFDAIPSQTLPTCVETIFEGEASNTDDQINYEQLAKLSRRKKIEVMQFLLESLK